MLLRLFLLDLYRSVHPLSLLFGYPRVDTRCMNLGFGSLSFVVLDGVLLDHEVGRLDEAEAVYLLNLVFSTRLHLFLHLETWLMIK